MNVPLLDLKAHHAAIETDVLDAITRVLRSGVFILGPEVDALEELIAARCGVRFAIGVSSGTDALLVALMALGVKPGDEVITSTYSFFATAGVVVRLGATPVLVDIDPVTYNLAADRVEAALTSRTKAIMPVHLFGQCADMEPILKIAARQHIAVVEDAAQAIGAVYADGRQAGSMGDIGTLSFFPSKNLAALGDAGMVVTNDANLADRLRILRVHGANPKYHHRFVGGNFRLDALQAAVLRAKLPHLEQWTRARQAHADLYDRLFAEGGLGTEGAVGLPVAVYRTSGFPDYHIYNQYVIRVREREALKAFLRSRGIGTEVYYPVPFHLQECFASLGHRVGDFPEAERAARDSLALPIYPELSPAQQEYVVDSIRTFYARA